MQIKKVMFTSDEININKTDRIKWHNFVRRREAEIAFSTLKRKKFDSALELGAGNGGQSVTIAKYCNKLICTEKNGESYAWLGKTILQRKKENKLNGDKKIIYKICDAQDLSIFKKNTFDLIFSSNVLEHIPDVRKCLQECRRVLKKDGLMLHTMPNRNWKICSHLFGMLKLKQLGIHGASSSHWREFITFGPNVWNELIESEGFEVTQIVGFPFYLGHGNQFISIIKMGNKLQIPTSNLYVFKKD